MAARVLLLAGVLLLGSEVMAEEARLAVTADTSISCHESEVDFNAGGAPRIKLKGTENLILLDFDSGPLKGKAVVSANLHVRGTGDGMMVRKVGVSTVAVPWAEGAQDYGKAGPEEACFLDPGTGAKGWTGPGLDFTYAVFGRAGTIWNMVYAEQGKDGWYTVPLDPRFLEACAAGLSHGLAFSDDNGQTMNIAPKLIPGMNRSNNYLWSRESGKDAPFIELSTGKAPRGSRQIIPIKVRPWPAGATADEGGLEAEWNGPRTSQERDSLLGYRVRIGGVEIRNWLTPTVPPPAQKARLLLRLPQAGTETRLEVDLVGRAGRVVASGMSRAMVSPRRPPVEPVALAVLSPRRGGPLETSAAVLWAVPDCAKVNPLTGNVLEEPGVDYSGEKAGKWGEGNPAWDGQAHAVTISAMRGEWIAFQIVVERKGQDANSFQVIPGAFTGLPGSFRAYRAWYQKTGPGEREWYADPLVPLPKGGWITLPDPGNAVPNQRNQSVYVEYRVPVDAKPGEYSAEIAVEPGGKKVPVRLKVEAGLVPQAAAFTWSLNTYNSPGWGFGKPDEAAFREAERAFYRMAHEHRATLAVLHYSHSGNFEGGCVPGVTGQGSEMRVADWNGWDERFGPLFDGSAFAETGREKVPLDHFFLALSENYPTTMAEGYQWNDLKWEDHWLKAGEVTEGFSRAFQEQWVAVARDYLKHIREKGWKTRFQVYLNDKYFYKQYDEGRKDWGRGVSFWLLDEPMHADDFRALSFFGGLLREAQPEAELPDRRVNAAQAGDRSRVVFRVDLSRPAWGRDMLDRVMDLDVSGGFRRYRELLDSWRDLYGQTHWTYGDLPRSTGSAAVLVAQALDLYSRGVDGYVPWQVQGDESNWKEFTTTCLVYTGKPFGISGPCPSLRLKAMRRGEQDVEYVRLLAEKRGLMKDDSARLNVAALLTKGPGSNRAEGRLDAQGAVTEAYSGTKLEEFEGLRRAIAEELAP